MDSLLLHRQRGSVLAMSLVILLVLTILGVNSMSALVLEEKMAGNTRQTMVASEAAGVALREGEQWIRDNVGDASEISQFFGGNDGLYSQAETLNPPGFEVNDDDAWVAAGASQEADTVDAVVLKGVKADSEVVARKPRFIIEYIGRVSAKASEDPLDIVSDRGPDTRDYVFRITAIGWGENTNARYLVQSTFRIDI